MFNEPLADLMKVLASLVDKDNRILVPGFGNLVRPNTLEPALERLTASSEFSLDGYRAALGIPRLVRPHYASSFSALACRHRLLALSCESVVFPQLCSCTALRIPCVVHLQCAPSCLALASVAFP